MSSGARKLSIIVGIGALCAGLGLASSAHGQPRASARAQRSALVSYREALMSWLPADTERRLDAVNTVGTANAAPNTIAFLAADHAVCRFAPMALAAIGKQADATRLRSLPPITDDASATRALGQIRMTIRAVEGASAANPGPRDGAALGAVRTALQNVQLALDVSHGGPRAQENAVRAIQGTSLAAHQGETAGVQQATIVDACVTSMRDMAEAVRRPARAGRMPEPRGAAARRF